MPGMAAKKKTPPKPIKPLTKRQEEHINKIVEDRLKRGKKGLIADR
jgi:hypothetical protein